MPERDYVLRVAPLPLQPLRWGSVLFGSLYYRLPYRIRGWGHFAAQTRTDTTARKPPARMESAVLISDLTIGTFSWRRPIFTVSSRRMWEPGFFAERLPGLSLALRMLNFGWLFSSIGLQPIENELY